MIYYCILGLLAGVLNGLFGAGGGIIVVPMLEKSGLEQKKSHATSIAIILPLCVISGIIYYTAGNIDLRAALNYLPGGIAGAILGSLILKKINNTLLRRIFGVILIITSFRIFMK